MSDHLQAADLGPVANGDEGGCAPQLGLTAAGERCGVCATPLSSDQRYCVNCGERRSQPRFPVTPAATAVTETAASTVHRLPRRASGSATLIAGVGTLLLAMGVGVLIGRLNSSSPRPAPAPKLQVVYLGGASPGTSTATSTATPSTARTTKSKGNAKSRTPAKPAPAAAAAASKASAAAGKVIGSKAPLPPPTVKVGQSGHGPGYNRGHFSGTFFGQ